MTVKDRSAYIYLTEEEEMLQNQQPTTMRETIMVEREKMLQTLKKMKKELKK